jgi:hypothetical protein
MRNGLVGLSSGVLLAAMAACSNGGGSGGTGGMAGTSSSGTAGTSSGAGTMGTGGSGGGGSVTTLPGTTAVNALSPTEVTQLCNDTYAYFGSAIAKATTCKWRGLAYAASSSAPSDAQAQSNCTSKESSCNQTDPWADNPGCNDIPTTCAATVAEYSSCISDEAAAFNQTVNGLKTCATLTRADTAALFDVMAAPPPASCMALMNKCPDLYPPSPLNTQ